MNYMYEGWLEGGREEWFGPTIRQIVSETSKRAGVQMEILRSEKKVFLARAYLVQADWYC